MSANAATWFYHDPEPNNFLISERLNATFWQARISGVYWRADRAEPPYHAVGYVGDQALEMEWLPRHSLSLKVPAAVTENGLSNGSSADDIVLAISKRILAMPASLSYVDGQGNAVYEWHADSGKHRWSEIQGKPGFGKPKRLNTK